MRLAELARHSILAPSSLGQDEHSMRGVYVKTLVRQIRSCVDTDVIMGEISLDKNWGD
jgi:hypothetical protein